MSVRNLLPNQPIAGPGGMPTPELVEIIQRMAREIRDLKARVIALEARP